MRFKVRHRVAKACLILAFIGVSAFALTALLPTSSADPALRGQDAASVLRGQVVYQTQCADCHNPNDHRTGPRHWGVLGRKAGSEPGYVYSNALKRSTVIWSRETLLLWLTDPEKLIPGQVMDFSLSDAGQRADVVAYLATLR